MDSHATMDSGGPPPSYESVMGMQYSSFEPKLIQQQASNPHESSFQHHHQQSNNRSRGSDYTPVTDRTASPSKISEPTVVMLKIVGLMVILVVFSTFIIYHMQAHYEQSKSSDEESSSRNEAVRRKSLYLPGSDGPLIHHSISASEALPDYAEVYVDPQELSRLIQMLKHSSTVGNSGKDNGDSVSRKIDETLFSHSNDPYFS